MGKLPFAQRQTCFKKLVSQDVVRYMSVFFPGVWDFAQTWMQEIGVQQDFWLKLNGLVLKTEMRECSMRKKHAMLIKNGESIFAWKRSQISNKTIKIIWGLFSLPAFPFNRCTAQFSAGLYNKRVTASYLSSRDVREHRRMSWHILLSILVLRV